MIDVKGQQGLSMLELMIVLALTAIILTTAGPAWNGLVESTSRRTLIAELITGFNLARNTAVQEQLITTICPLDSDDHCSHDWSGPITIFRDAKKARRLENAKQIIRIIDPADRGKLVVRSASRPYFGFRNNGMANSAIGNLTWCPNDKNPKEAVQLRINMGGRLQTARDQDGDGIVEDSSGDPISCI